MTTLELPYPSLAEGRFASISLYTDEKLFDLTGVRIAFTTRHGGVSEGEYGSLNFGSHVGDDIEAVKKNRKILLETLGFFDAGLIVPNQVHGDSSLVIDSLDVEKHQSEADEGIDALILNEKNIAGLLCFADCVPVIIVLPTGLTAVIHAGWRGVDNKICVSTLERMISLECQEKNFSSDEEMSFKQELVSGANVYIGAHIHAECFETSSEIRAQFGEKFGTVCTPDDRHVDLQKALSVQLTDAGVQEKRIASVGKCTVCNNEEFFSYRAQNGVAGRHGAFAIRTK